MVRRPLLYAGAALGALVVALVAWQYFLPQGSSTVDEMLADVDATLVSSGSFRGADSLHRVSGNVALYRGDDGFFLRFEDYDATDGPDVYLYLVPAGGERDPERDGHRVLVPGGAKDGQATLRGNFNVPLGAGMDFASYGGIAVWCDRFDVLFGSAALS